MLVKGVGRRGEGARGRASRRGFTFVELLASLIILAAAALVLGELLVTSIRTSTDSAKRQDSIQRIDAMVGLLRKDVWGAEVIQTGKSELVLQAGGRAIAWHQQDDGTLTRSETAAGKDGAATTPAPRVWRQIPSMKFTQDGALVRVSMANKERISFISQRMVAGGGT